MPDRSKIATCNYCGTRTILRPTARDGHELACAACGAPLHEMKWLRAPADDDRDHPGRRSVGPTQARRRPVQVRPRRKPKKRKSLWRKLAEEAFDLVEEVFD